MQKSLATKVSMLKQMSKPEKKSSGLTVESA